MARLNSLPHIDIINALKGTIDFYIHRGVPCARRWPRYRPASRSAPAIASANLFGQIVKSYSIVADPILDALRGAAADNPRTARDILVSAVLGHLHEATMGDFLNLLTEARDFLQDLTALLGALDSVDTDELVVNVDESVLPAGAATAAHQVTQNNALATIAQLEHALQTVATDRLKTRGEDQLFSIKDALAKNAYGDIASDDGALSLPAVTAGEIWAITNLHFACIDSALTEVRLRLRHNGTNSYFGGETRAIPMGEYWYWAGFLLATPTDLVDAFAIGAAANDTCRLHATGHIITLET